MAAGRMFNVLFLCTGNSARSVMAEALLEVLGRGRFRAFSAGSQPSGRVQPLAAELAAQLGYDPARLRSKSWDEFAAPGAPEMDLIITVCDNAAGEVCPVWPGHPATAHWGYADPSAGDAPDDAKREAFRRTMQLIKHRLEMLIQLPPEKLARAGLQDSARTLARS